jgi:hypothetical protein
LVAKRNNLVPVGRLPAKIGQLLQKADGQAAQPAVLAVMRVNDLLPFLKQRGGSLERFSVFAPDRIPGVALSPLLARLLLSHFQIRRINPAFAGPVAINQLSGRFIEVKPLDNESARKPMSKLNGAGIAFCDFRKPLSRGLLEFYGRCAAFINARTMRRDHGCRARRAESAPRRSL